MKRRKIILLFLLIYIGSLVSFILLYKNFTIGSKGSLSWQEIYDTFHVFLIACFFPAIFLAFKIFAGKYTNKKD